MHPTHETTDPNIVGPAETLRAAALYLARHGWYQAVMFDTDDPSPFPAVCAIGAITIVTHGYVKFDAPFAANVPDDFLDAVTALTNHLVPELSFTDMDARIEWVMGWNDQFESTQDQVHADLLAAANAAEQTPGGAA